MNLQLPPDPYTEKQRASALPDDYDHPVRNPMRTGQGPGIRCGQLVVAPGSSAYGIRPCLSVTKEVGGKLRHYNYARQEDGTTDWSKRVVGR